jgi:signal transduction histidine kinase
MFNKLILTIVIITLALGFAFAVEKTDAEKAKELVGDAVKYFEANGKEATLKELSTKDGKFYNPPLYVFAYDLEGVLVGHPFKPELLGKNLMEKTDSKGKLFRKEINKIAKEKGSGWVDYYYMNPKTGKEAAKTTYFEKAGELIICCGIYK